MINIWLLIITGLTIGWVYMVYWVDNDIYVNKGERREHWTMLTFFTGPVGFIMYFVQRKDNSIRCPYCGKKLADEQVAVCPHCKTRFKVETTEDFFSRDLLTFDDASVKIANKEEATLLTLPDSQEKWSIIKAVKMIIAKAFEDNATDIHLEPEQNSLRIRYRVDGVLQPALIPPVDMQAAIIPCIKAMSDLDVAERRKPLDGRMQIFYKGHKTDLRVSTTPTIFGEKIVLRILDREKALMVIENLGMPKDIADRYKRLISSPQGMILATGPTGSGKTTSLYASLSMIDNKSSNITTIEDPVEYQLDGITQIPINVKADVTFASGLRSILRQDPDIIMVGEIRDKETAEIAIRAALTGHLIFSTLHTNDAIRAVTRLMDIGIEPYLISASVLAVLAQRLVRVNCPHCIVPENPTDQLLLDMGVPTCDRHLFKTGRGCDQCKFTGFTGRTGVFELLLLNDQLRKMIDENASAVSLREVAIENGMKTMLDDGLIKAREGKVSLGELSSIIQIQ